MEDKGTVYGDAYGRLLLFERLYPQTRLIPATPDSVTDEISIFRRSFIFLRSWNIEKQDLALWNWEISERGVEYKKISTTLPHSENIKNRSVVYDNGRARILAPR